MALSTGSLISNQEDFIDMLIGLFDRAIPQLILSSGVCLVCIKLTENNQLGSTKALLKDRWKDLPGGRR